MVSRCDMSLTTIDTALVKQYVDSGRGNCVEFPCYYALEGRRIVDEKYMRRSCRPFYCVDRVGGGWKAERWCTRDAARKRNM